MLLPEQAFQLNDVENSSRAANTVVANRRSSDVSASSWDDDMDELMAWFNKTIICPQSQEPSPEETSKLALRAKSTPTLIGTTGASSVSTIISKRLEDCQSEYLQSPTAKQPQKLQLIKSTKTSPEDCLQELFQKRGFNCSDVKVPDNLFLNIEEEHIEAYSIDISNAARKGDLSYLQDCLEKGKSLQCCNRHGESIIHAVCRRGHAQVLKFLVEKAAVHVMVRDDVGRTPLHDAAWSGSPNFELIQVLLEHAPQMIHVKDSRNHTPLSYVPRAQWGPWCEFLQNNEHLLI